MNIADLHVHPSLPRIGSVWRRRVQGFRIDAFDEDGSREGKAGLGDGIPPDRGVAAATAAPGRIYGASFYVTCLLRPSAARTALFRALQAFRDRRIGSGSRPPGESLFLAVESLRWLSDPADLKRLWDLGVRSVQPIHFLDTPWGGSSREGALPESRRGLSPLGRELIAEAAHVGFILDIAHMSRRTAEDSLALFKGPVMCSHTGCASLNANPRNVPDDLAREIFRRGGMVGVTCWRHLLRLPHLSKKPAKDRAFGTRAAWTRSAWTQAYCEAALAFASLSPDARVGIGSDRGAPIIAPPWFYSPDHLDEMAACFARAGWDEERTLRFFRGDALDFLARSLPR